MEKNTPRRNLGKAALDSLIKIARANGKLTFFCHQNADPDSACSAIALRSLIEEIAPEVESVVVCPQGISRPTRQLIHNLALESPLELLPKEPIRVAVLVDTNNLSQLGATLYKELASSSVPVVIIDHHHKHPEMRKTQPLEITDASSSSTAEIVLSLYKSSRKKIGSKIAEALLATIFIETRSFALANHKTFQNAAYLAARGADPRSLHDLIGNPPTRAERVARLKAASRLRLESVNDWLVASTEVGSYQSSVARSLISIGSDVAVVGGTVKGIVRVSLRATEQFHTQTGIHLARDITIPLGSELEGSGGGHPTAAGMSVKGTAEAALEKCLQTLRKLLPRGLRNGQFEA